MRKITTWRPQGHFPPRSWPPALAPWLLDRDSMTQRLRQCCGSHFHLQLHSQVWAAATLNECHALGIPSRERVLVRQVLLCCDRRILMVARSLFPISSFRGHGRALRPKLGPKPLGDWLFKPPYATRSPLQLAKLSKKNQEYQWAASLVQGTLPDTLWARRSIFHWRGQPLLVLEAFCL